MRLLATSLVLLLQFASRVASAAAGGPIDDAALTKTRDSDAARSTNNRGTAPAGQCKTCKTPDWAWDTVGHMAFTHTCNMSGPWSGEALDVLTKFPLVNIERFQAQHELCFAAHKEDFGPPGGWFNQTSGTPACRHVNPHSPGYIAGCNCTVEEAPIGLTAHATGKFVEDHTIAALKQLKQRNPNITTIFYHDTGRMWTNDQPSAGHGAPDSGRVPAQNVSAIILSFVDIAAPGDAV